MINAQDELIKMLQKEEKVQRSPLNFEFVLDIGLADVLAVQPPLSSLLAPNCVHAGWQPLSLKSDYHLASSADAALETHGPAAP